MAKKRAPVKAAIEQRLKALEDRLAQLEADHKQLLAEARSAATAIAGAVISDAITRITRLEGDAEKPEPRKQPRKQPRNQRRKRR
jgi:hypothetical protein